MNRCRFCKLPVPPLFPASVWDGLAFEPIIIPDDIRAMIPEDFGRSMATSWYFLFGHELIVDEVKVPWL